MEEIGKILPKVLKPHLSRQEPPVVEVLAPLWIRVAGKALAKECRPVAFRAGTLTLATEDPDWAEPLQQMADEIRAHVNSFLGKPLVKQVRISSLHKLAREDKSDRKLEGFPVLQSKRREWPRQAPGMASVAPVAMEHSRVKDFRRKREKVQ